MKDVHNQYEYRYIKCFSLLREVLSEVILLFSHLLVFAVGMMLFHFLTQMLLLYAVLVLGYIIRLKFCWMRVQFYKNIILKKASEQWRKIIYQK
jgi:hypothetical protein